MEGNDEIVAEYLEALDRYEKAQLKLSEGMKNGFLDLARANYAAGLTRYGQDHTCGGKEELLALKETEAPDSLRMFGILVPLPLREAKKSFVSALDGAIEVLNARHALQRLEEEVHKLKNQKDCPVEDESKSTKSENNDCSSVWAESNKR